MTNRQLAHSVKNKEAVRFHFFDTNLPPIEGYVCGMDDFHWMVVTDAGSRHLIHKGSVARIDLDDEGVNVEESVVAFRQFVLREYYGQETE